MKGMRTGKGAFSIHCDERRFTALVRLRDIKIRLRPRLEVMTSDEPGSGIFVYPTYLTHDLKRRRKKKQSVESSTELACIDYVMV